MVIEFENLTREQKNSVEILSTTMVDKAEAMACEIARLAMGLATEIILRAAHHEKYWVCWDKSNDDYRIVCLAKNPHDSPANCGWGIVTLAGPFLSEQDARESYEYWREQSRAPSVCAGMKESGCRL